MSTSDLRSMEIFQDSLYDIIRQGHVGRAIKLQTRPSFDAYAKDKGVRAFLDVYGISSSNPVQSQQAREVIADLLVKSGIDINKAFCTVSSYFGNDDFIFFQLMSKREIIEEIIKRPSIDDLEPLTKKMNLDFFLKMASLEDMHACSNPKEAFSRLYRMTGDKALLPFANLRSKGMALEEGLGL